MTTSFHHDACDARWTLEGTHSMAVCPNCSILIYALTRHPVTEKLMGHAGPHSYKVIALEPR